MKKLSIILMTALLLAACGEEEAAPVEPEEVEMAEETPVEEEVALETNVDTTDGKATVTGTTNLPDGGELMTTLESEENEFRAQSKNIIENGTFTADTFSDKGEALPPGNYILTVSLSIASTQSDEFVEQTGENYENLSGSLMQESDLGKSMSYETEFIIE